MSLKIYFSGSIKGGRGDAELYSRIIKELQSYGTILNLSEHTVETDNHSEEKHDSKYIHDRDLEWLKQCDVLVAEVTQPSLGVGYEIGRVVTMNKPILCLFRPDSGKSLSSMIQGAHNGDTVTVKQYAESEFKEILTTYFQRFKK